MVGLPAIFLFRHYLELMLKRIILAGRFLAAPGAIAPRDQVKQVAKIHVLPKLWESALNDAKPKIAEWDNYDIAFIEACIKEFDDVDKQGFAFRYERQGGEFCEFDFGALNDQLDHVRQVLEGIFTCLDVAYDQIKEYEEYLDWEYGQDAAEYGAY